MIIEAEFVIGWRDKWSLQVCMQLKDNPEKESHMFFSVNGSWTVGLSDSSAEVTGSNAETWRVLFQGSFLHFYINCGNDS